MGVSITRRRVERRTALLKGSLALAACLLAAGSAGLIRPASSFGAHADAGTRADASDIDAHAAADDADSRAASADRARRSQGSWLGGEVAAGARGLDVVEGLQSLWPGVEAFGFLRGTRADSGAAIRTDRRVYAQPPLAEPTAAGQTYRDPVFGTLIMRATDAADCPAPGCGTWYSNWPTFNADDTRILIRRGDSGDVLIRSFDPVNFTLGPVLRTTPHISGTTPNWQAATWSHTDPDLIYLPGAYYDANYPASGIKLYSYRPSTDTFKLVKDFAPALSAAGLPDHFFEMHMDAKDDLFVFSRWRVGVPVNPVGFIVWRRSDDRLLLNVPRDSRLDSRKGTPDKSGRWVLFPLNDHNAQADGAADRLWDSQTGSWDAVRWAASDDTATHGDMGTGTMIGHGNFSGAFNVRSLDSLHTPRVVFAVKDAAGVTDWSYDEHTTLYADDESWATVAFFDDPGWKGPGRTGAFENEVVQIATDGSQRIRRLLHHRSKVDNKATTSGYWAQPKPTISRDGRFIAYTSNWGGTDRYDLFIAKIEPAPPLTRSPARPGPASRPRRVGRAQRRGAGR